MIVERPRASGRRDHDEHGLAHLEQWHDDLVEHAEIHVRRLLAIDDVAAHASEGVWFFWGERMVSAGL
jgi:hypothetical protein